MLKVMSKLKPAMLVAAMSGCVSNSVQESRPGTADTIEGIQVSLDTPSISLDGVANFPLTLRNTSLAPVCIAPVSEGFAEIRIRDVGSRLRIFGQDPDIGLERPTNIVTPIYPAYDGRPSMVKPGEAVSISASMQPIEGAYLVNSEQVGVRRYVKGFALSSEAVIIVFDCKYKSLGEALTASDFTLVTSNTQRLRGDVDALVKLPRYAASRSARG